MFVVNLEVDSRGRVRVETDVGRVVTKRAFAEAGATVATGRDGGCSAHGGARAMATAAAEAAMVDLRGILAMLPKA